MRTIIAEAEEPLTFLHSPTLSAHRRVDGELRKSRRQLAFFGHPVTQWHTRLRVFVGLFTDQKEENEPDAYLFGADVDPIRAGLLAWLGVSRVEKNMAWFTSTAEGTARVVREETGCR